MSAGRKNNSQNKSWGTPIKYVKVITEFFDGKIELDPCSNEYSIVNAQVEYLLPHKDGLKEIWNAKKIFVNPPYGRDSERGTSIKNWLAKCKDTFYNNHSEILALIPVATNTSHWKENIYNHANSICFLSDSRLKFLENGKEGGKGAPMACAIIYWGSDYEKFKRFFDSYGFVVKI